MGNAAVALSPYGFIMLNGMMHFALTAVMGAPLEENPGFFTGTFLFLPLLVLSVAVALRGGHLRVGGVAVLLASGAIAHGLLGAGYAMSAIGGPVGVIALDLLASLSPGMLACAGCNLFKIRIGSGLTVRKD